MNVGPHPEPLRITKKLKDKPRLHAQTEAKRAEEERKLVNEAECQKMELENTKKVPFQEVFPTIRYVSLLQIESLKKNSEVMSHLSKYAAF